MTKEKQQSLIEFKGSTVPTIIVTIRSLEPEALGAAASTLFGDSDFFDGDTGILDLSQTSPQESADWPTLQTNFATHGLKLIGVRGGNPELQASALAAGLPIFPEDTRSSRPAPEAPPVQAPVQETPPPEPKSEPKQETKAADTPQNNDTALPALVVDRPLRSGQRIYAQNRDLIVLAAVNAGAEVIADGNIHIYAPLRGRALAGASGNAEARILTTRFEAELVSIAGVYRTFESGVPQELAARPVQVQLTGDPTKLLLAPLKVD